MHPAPIPASSLFIPFAMKIFRSPFLLAVFAFLVIASACPSISSATEPAAPSPENDFAKMSDFAKPLRPTEAITGRREAENYLKSLPLDPLEGIWEYPADETSLLILKSRHEKGKYEIFLLESVDCRFVPGMIVGTATATPDATQFSLSLNTRLKKGQPCNPMKCAAKLSSNNEVLVIKAPKVKFTLTPSIILPTLWNTLRLGMRIKAENPAEKLPDGWIKSYPTFDGNPRSKTIIRYL